MTNDPNTPNPYAPPPMVIDTTSQHIVMAKTIKDFKQQSLALGVVWILFAVIALALAGYLGTLTSSQAELSVLGPVNLVLIAILGLSGAGWLVSGIGTLMRQAWGIYTGLVFSYVSLAGNIFNVNICAIVLLAAIILQAHRVLKFMRAIQHVGIDLKTI